MAVELGVSSGSVEAALLLEGGICAPELRELAGVWVVGTVSVDDIV